MRPTKVKIGPETFKIDFRYENNDGMLNDGNYGYTLDQGNLIVVSLNIDISKQRVTLMHEMLHACRMVLEGSSKPKKKADYEEWEHHFISIFENGCMMLIRENPEVMAWLQAD